MPSQLSIQTIKPTDVQSGAYNVSLTVTMTDVNSKLYNGVGANLDWTKSGLTIPIYVADPCTGTTLKKVNSTANTDPGLSAPTV